MTTPDIPPGAAPPPPAAEPLTVTAAAALAAADKARQSESRPGLESALERVATELRCV